MGCLLKSLAVSFLAKCIAPEELKGILMDVNKKGYYFLPDQLEIVIEQLSSPPPKKNFSRKRRLIVGTNRVWFCTIKHQVDGFLVEFNSLKLHRRKY